MEKLFRRNGQELNDAEVAKVTMAKNGQMGSFLEHFSCTKCGGEGGNQVWNYTGYTCYRCMGKTTIVPGLGHVDPSSPAKIPVYTAEKLAKLNAAAEKKANKKAAKAEEKKNNFLEEYQDVLDAGKYYGMKNNIVKAIVEFCIARNRMSEKQEQMLYKLFRLTQCRIEKEKDQHVPEHVGRVGDKMEMALTIIWEQAFASQYGAFWIVVYHSEKGDSFTYKGASPKGKKGEKEIFSFKIKAHEEYKGKKINIIERIKKVEKD